MFAYKMFGVCLRYAQNRESAEDFLQDGFIRVFEKIGTYRFQGSFEGWMRRIMVNMIIESYRKNRITTEFKDDFGDDQTLSSEENTDETSPPSLDVLLQWVQQLTVRYRMVFNLYVLEGLSHAEIAEELKITEGTSKSNLARARRWLQQKVREYNNNEAVRT
mgnify:CR=1 FL=1